MKKQTRIFAFHLLNDRSGSPKVLGQLLRDWVESRREVHLYTSQNSDGFLSGIKGVTYHDGWYVYQSNQWLRLIYYTLSQIVLMFRMMGKIKSGDIVYVNTVLPFGAALAGKLKGARVIYHIHESTVSPGILKWFLFRMVKWTASNIISVSKYVQRAHGITSIPGHMVYNAIPETYLKEVLPIQKDSSPRHVLMVCSLKGYKGVMEFVSLAHDHPEFRFRLVLNARRNEIDEFFKQTQIPENLELIDSQSNMHPHYQWADAILNLSRPDGWVETFGLTILEGMAYGLPAIVPPVGGILEVIEEGITGFCVDSRDRDHLNRTLRSMFSDRMSYYRMSTESRFRLNLFREQRMVAAVREIIDHQTVL